MAVQLFVPRPATLVLPPIIEPTPPAQKLGQRVPGYRLGQDRKTYVISPEYADHVGVAQRIVARYALGYDSRAGLSERYGYSERTVQQVIRGQTFAWFTRPVRARLLARGIGNDRMVRDDIQVRQAQMIAAYERVSAQAVLMLRRPERFSAEQRETVALDLWLLSGAWREEGTQIHGN